MGACEPEDNHIPHFYPESCTIVRDGIECDTDVSSLEYGRCEVVHSGEEGYGYGQLYVCIMYSSGLWDRSDWPLCNKGIRRKHRCKPKRGG